MGSVNYGLKSFSHCVGQNWYHVVLTTRARYPVFEDGVQRDLCERGLVWVCGRHGFEVFSFKVMSNHVHLFASCPPDCSVRRMIGMIKGGSSYFVRRCKPSLKKYPALWSRGFMYRSVGAVSAELVDNYIRSSNSWVPSGQTRLR